MGPEKPVLSVQELEYAPASERELDVGIDWAKTQYEKDVDRDMLRVLFNTANERRTSQPRSALPDLVSLIVREGVPLSDKQEAHKRSAYKGAIMKIFAGRSAWRSKNAARKRKHAAEEAQRSKDKKTRHPEDARPKYKGQYKLL